MAKSLRGPKSSTSGTRRTKYLQSVWPARATVLDFRRIVHFGYFRFGTCTVCYKGYKMGRLPMLWVGNHGKWGMFYHRGCVPMKERMWLWLSKPTLVEDGIV